MNQYNHKIWVIIPAAGVGARMQAQQPKQYMSLLGRPVLIHCLERLSCCLAIDGVAVGLSQGDDYWPGLNYQQEKFLGTFVGGAQRALTVLNGLDYLAQWADKDDWVLVHDAVRPCVRVSDIDSLIKQAQASEVGALLAIRVVDTVKKVSHGLVDETLDRNSLVLAATPQMFRFGLLQRALQDAVEQGRLNTDESSAVEALGLKPLVVLGARDNLKLTSAEDMFLIKQILQYQREFSPDKS